MKLFGYKKYGDNLLFALALAVLMTALFYSVSTRRARQAELTTIEFTQWWQGDLERDTLRSLIAEFESLHEGIRVILNEMPYTDLRFDLFTSGTYDDGAKIPPGDVLALNPFWVPDLLNRGIIESAETPILSFINVLYYNIDILREAGFTRPPKTRGEFLTFARAVAANEGTRAAYALGLGLGNSPRGVHDDVFPWIWAAGAQLIRDGNPVVTTAPVVQSLAFLASLNNEGLIAPGAFYADSRQKLEDFISGRTAFMIAPTRYIAFVRDRMEEGSFNITSVPMLDNQMGIPFFASVGWTLGIHAGSAHKEEARLLSAFLAGRALHLSNNARGAIPAYTVPDAQMGRASPLAPFYSNIWEIVLAGEAAADFSGLTGEPAAGAGQGFPPLHALEEIFRDELSALFAGTASPAETAAAIQTRWLAVLR